MTERNAELSGAAGDSGGDAPPLAPAHGRDLVRDAQTGLIKPPDAPTGLLRKLMVLARRSKVHPVLLGAYGTCVARATRVEEDGFADGPFVGCAGRPLP